MIMHKIAFACLLCAGHGRRLLSSIPEKEGSGYEEMPEVSFARLLLASAPAASFAHGVPASRFAGTFDNPTYANSRPLAMDGPRFFGRGLHNVHMEEGYEPTDKAVTLGAAALGGALGVQLYGEVLPAIIFSILFAYLSTLSNGLGGATKKAGSLAAKAYKKTTEINEEFSVLPKVKGAADTVVTVADNLNKNYGVTDKITSNLPILPVSEKIEELKGDIGSKIDDLKSKASSK